MKMRKSFKIILGLAICLLPLSVGAFVVQNGDYAEVKDSETVDGNYYFAGDTLDVRGAVLGDVICAGNKINISGKVEGDVICAGSSITISGEVKGSVIFVGNDLEVSGNVYHNVRFAGSSLTLARTANVGWDANFFAEKVSASGKIEKNLHGAAQLVNIYGNIGKDVNLEMFPYSSDKNQPALIIASDAKVDGDLYYRAITSASFSTSSVLGKVERTEPQRNQTDYGNLAMNKLLALCSLLVIGLLLILLFPKRLKEMADHQPADFWKALFRGFLILTAIPVAIIILLFSVIGIPLALIILALYIPGLFLASVASAIMIGMALSRILIKKQPVKSPILEMILGVVIIWILFMIPVIGIIFRIVSIFTGFGVLCMYIQRHYVKA